MSPSASEKLAGKGCKARNQTTSNLVEPDDDEDIYPLRIPLLPRKRRRAPRPGADGHARFSLLPLLTGRTMLVFALAVTLFYRALSMPASPPPPQHPPENSMRQRLIDAKAHHHRICVPFQDPSFLAHDTTLPPLLNLTAKISRSVELADELSALLSSRLPCPIKAAVHTGNCSILPHIQPAVFLAQVYTPNITDDLGLSVRLYDDALSSITAAATNVQKKIARASSQARLPKRIFNLALSLTKARHQKIRNILRTGQADLDRIGPTTRDLTVGRQLVNQEYHRYLQLQVGLDRLQQETTTALTGARGAGFFADANLPCLTFTATSMQRAFLAAMSSILDDAADEELFRGYYDGLGDSNGACLSGYFDWTTKAAHALRRVLRL